MTRRLAAAAVLAFALAGAAAAPHASAANCGPELDLIAKQLPAPLYEVYLIFCGA